MTNTGNDAGLNPGHASIIPSPFSEIPKQIGLKDNTSMKNAAEIPVAQAIQTFMLMEAKAKAETAELQKRLVMQQFRPSKLYPVCIRHDGLRWVCEYIAMIEPFSVTEAADALAYGMSPEEAAQNFDRLWTGVMDDELDGEEPGDEDT
jgi:hypothetical protein